MPGSLRNHWLFDKLQFLRKWSNQTDAEHCGFRAPDTRGWGSISASERAVGPGAVASHSRWPTACRLEAAADPGCRAATRPGSQYRGGRVRRTRRGRSARKPRPVGHLCGAAGQSRFAASRFAAARGAALAARAGQSRRHLAGLAAGPERHSTASLGGVACSVPRSRPASPALRVRRSPGAVHIAPIDCRMAAPAPRYTTRSGAGRDHSGRGKRSGVACAHPFAARRPLRCGEPRVSASVSRIPIGGWHHPASACRRARCRRQDGLRERRPECSSPDAGESVPVGRAPFRVSPRGTCGARCKSWNACY